MERPSNYAKSYAIVPKDRADPNYVRVARLLSNDDLRDELRLGRGEPGYKRAIREEAKTRGIL